LETVKLTLSKDEESKDSTATTISTLAKIIVTYLHSQRDDGNKVYHVQKISSEFGG
jgi:hypothetical protein